MTNEEKINLIGQKILILSNNLDKYQSELEQLKQQLAALQQHPVVQQPVVTPPPVVKTPEPVITPVPEIINELKTEIPELKQKPVIAEPVRQQPVQPKVKAPSDFNFEAFIGGKLITVIGIVILVIGLGIGVKYAIDNDMLGPLARIVLAYIAGGILLALAFRLKAGYKAFSAVLLSGGMASLYFTTFAAYSMYGLFPQMAAFAVMVIFTAFTVFAATVYGLEVIGIIGLAGAYAVPMLLSDGSGKIEIMFTYMLIINTGILILSFKKYWQVLNHIAFGLTWLIVGGWIIGKYDYTVHAAMVMIFTFLFFIIFYISNLSYKILKHETFGAGDVIRLLLNSFLFFGTGYGLLNNEYYENYLGLFTLTNALVHLVFSYIVFRNKLLDRRLFYLLIAMVLSFTTIAVPVQLEGNWVTLFWSTEAVLLFFIGRYRKVRFYEWLGAIMIVLSVFSLLNDWEHSYYQYDYDLTTSISWVPLANIHLLTSLFFILALGAMLLAHHQKALTAGERAQYKIYKVIDYFFPVLLFVITYMAFANELNTFFKARYEQSHLQVPAKETWAEPGTLSEVWDDSWLRFRNVASGIYTMLFFSITTALVLTKWKNNLLRWTVFSFDMLIAGIFIFTGLYELSELRNYYLSQGGNSYLPLSSWMINIRYVCFLLFGIFLFLVHKLLKSETFGKFNISRLYTGCLLHFFIIVILSVELVNLNILNDHEKAMQFHYATKAVYKLGFTALWGIYSFALIAFGIFRRNRIMRISAICLFGLTLIKLVTFDTWDLSSGYKVIAFMLLGVILLVVAFLYQKFKVLIFGDDQS